VVLFIGRAVLVFLDTAFKRGFKVNKDLKERFPGLEERANRYISTLKGILKLAVCVLVVFALFQAWGINAMGWLASGPGKVLGSTVARILAILVITFIIWELANSLIQAYLSEKDGEGNIVEPNARTRTLLTVGRKALFVLLAVVSVLMILSELGVNIGPLLAGAGVLGLAVGFGSQKLVQDIVTGVFILLEDQISVDDVVKVADKAGLVEAVSIRSVRLRDFSGTVHTIPYSSIGTVSNLTKDFSFSVFEIGVAYREDVDEVMAVLQQIGADLQEDPEFGPLILEPLEVAGLDSFGDSAVVIKARIKTIPLKQWAVGRQFNRRMKKKFDELGIEIPFPHTTVYFGENKGGGAPPAYVRYGQNAEAEGNL
jgi:small conductance mechanosensitive channel